MTIGASQFSCSAPECYNPVRAKGLCNAHYIRQKKGSCLETPVRRSERGRKCKIDGCEEKHYGNDLCVKHWKVWSRYKVKKELILHLGGKCKSCGGIFHPAAFDFHHLDPSKKEYSITEKLNRLPFNKLLEEAKKCVLLCANCHRVHHAGDDYEG